MDSFVLYQCSRCGEATCCNVLGMDFMCRSCGREMEECGVYVHSDINAELLAALEAALPFVYVPSDDVVEIAAASAATHKARAAIAKARKE